MTSGTWDSKEEDELESKISSNSPDPDELTIENNFIRLDGYDIILS